MNSLPMIGMKIEFKEYILFIPLIFKGKILDKCRTFWGDRYLVEWERDKHF